MKAGRSVVLALAGACLAGRVEAQGVVVGPQASAISTVRHGVTTVPVVVEATGGGDSLGSLAARLNWRPGVLRLVGTSAGTLGALAVNADSAAGLLRFALAIPTGVSGRAVVLNATFEAVGAPGDTASITVAVDEASRARTFVDITSLVIATSARFCVSTGRWGDLNLNDTLSGFDALLMLTEGVGLPIAPYTTVNGDVDGNGRIDSRDALIVLSAAVGLPTPGLRVGALNTGNCAVRSVVSLALAPLGPTLAPGDRVRAVAVAYDSVGQIVNSAPVTWGVSDTAIAVVDPAGNVYARAAGSVRVYAVALPGVRDSATITVGGVRHTWYVDPARAATRPSQTGTAFDPFATFAQALTAAATGDTVRVAPGTYTEPLRVFKPVVVVGDSGAAGWPRLLVAGAPAIVIDSLPAATATVVNLAVAGGTAGVATGDVDVTLRGLRIAGVAGPGIVARGTRRLAVDRSSVAGPGGRGVDFEGPGAISLSRVTVSQVPADAGVRIVGAGSVALDSLQVSTVSGDGSPDAAAVRLDLLAATTVAAHDITASASLVPGIVVTGGGAVTLRRLVVDHSQVPGQLHETARFTGVATLLLDSLRVDAAGGIVRLGGSGVGTAELRAPVLNGAAVEVSGLAQLRVTGGAITAPPKKALIATGIPSVTVAGTQVLAASSLGGGDLGIAIAHADSANVSDVAVHGIAGLPVDCSIVGGRGAVRVDTTRAVVLQRNNVLDVACYGIMVYESEAATVSDNHVTGVQVSGMSLGYTRLVNMAGNVVRNVLRRPGATVYGAAGISVAWGDTLRSTGDSVVNVGATGLTVYSMSAGFVDRLVVLLPDRDSINGVAVYFTKGRYVLTNSHLADTRSNNLVSVYGTTTRLFSRGNRLERSGYNGISTWGSPSGNPVVGFADTLVSVADTVLTTRRVAIRAEGAKYVRVDSAVVDSAAYEGITVAGTSATVFMSTGVRVSRALYGIYNDSSASATIENATLTDYRGTGVYVRYGGPVVLRSVVATLTQPYSGSGLILSGRRAVVLSDIVARRNTTGINLWSIVDSVRGTRLRVDSGGTGIVLGQTGNARLDSVTLSDNYVAGLYVTGVAVQTDLRLTASTIRRNAYAVRVFNPAQVSIWGSVFSSNPQGVANVSSVYPVDADSNYWGDARGPRCNVAVTGVPCDTASTGDSVQTANVLFLPFLTAAPEVFAAPPAGAARGTSPARLPSTPASRRVEAEPTTEPPAVSRGSGGSGTPPQPSAPWERRP